LKGIVVFIGTLGGTEKIHRIGTIAFKHCFETTFDNVKCLIPGNFAKFPGAIFSHEGPGKPLLVVDKFMGTPPLDAELSFIDPLFGGVERLHLSITNPEDDATADSAEGTQGLHISPHIRSPP
jgi:hypothetical protein